MLIRISESYRGRHCSALLEPGEHDVPSTLGNYLVGNMGGPPFFAVAVETKPAMDIEVKPMLPEEIKAEAQVGPGPAAKRVPARKAPARTAMTSRRTSPKTKR